MPDGGNMIIETRNVDLDAEHVRGHPDVSPGPYVLLEVTDTGVGMDASTRARLSEPFFTTKLSGRGTGLGLSTVFGIVRESAGHIDIETAPNLGSTFRVYLPKADGSVDSTAPPPGPSDAPPVGQRSETLLLVEDDEDVRAVARGILRREGFRVLEAANGGEALLICEQHGGAIHLLVTDVVLPRMSGRRLADRLARMRPEMKVLFISGHTEDAVLAQGVVKKDVPFLQKPFTPGILSRKVRDALGVGDPDAHDPDDDGPSRTSGRDEP
jgi:CheY-like chemotaxis protein